MSFQYQKKKICNHIYIHMSWWWRQLNDKFSKYLLQIENFYGKIYEFSAFIKKIQVNYIIFIFVIFVNDLTTCSKNAI